MQSVIHNFSKYGSRFCAKKFRPTLLCSLTFIVYVFIEWRINKRARLNELRNEREMSNRNRWRCHIDLLLFMQPIIGQTGKHIFIFLNNLFVLCLILFVHFGWPVNRHEEKRHEDQKIVCATPTNRQPLNIFVDENWNYCYASKILFIDRIMWFCLINTFTAIRKWLQ